MIQSNEKIASKCVRLHDAYGKILLTDIYAKCNVPSFKASANHGFAVKANDRKNRKKILEAGSTVSDIITVDISLQVSITEVIRQDCFSFWNLAHVYE